MTQWGTFLLRQVKRLGLWTAVFGAASVYPLYHGFQAYRLGHQIEQLEKRPEYVLLNNLDSKGQFLRRTLQEYPSLSPEAQGTLNDTIEVLVREYVADVRQETAEQMDNNGGFEDRVTADLLAVTPHFSKQSEAFTKQLFEQANTELKNGRSPWTIISHYPALLSRWVDAIQPDIGDAQALRAKVCINQVFEKGYKTLVELDEKADQMGHHNFHLVVGGLASMMLALLTITIVQGRIIKRHEQAGL